MAMTREQKIAALEAHDQQQSAGLTREQKIALLEQNDAQPQKAAPGVIEQTLKGLDYQRAVTGGPAVAKVLDMFGGDPAYNQKEVEAARNFEAPYPNTSELLRRKGFLDHSPWTRGALGLVGDTVTDPVTYETGGVSALAKKFPELAAFNLMGRSIKPLQALNTVVNPAEAFFRGRPQKIMGKAFESLDKVAPVNGVKASEILAKDGFVGTAEDAAKRLEQINAGAGGNIGHIVKRASNEGVLIWTKRALAPALEKAQELRNIGTKEMDSLAADIEERVTRATQQNGGLMTPEQANKLKKSLNDLITSSGYQAGNEAALTKQAQMAIAGGMAEGVPEAIAAHNPEMGKSLLEHNKLYGSTTGDVAKAAEDAAQKEAARGGTFGLSKSDMGLLMGAGSAAVLHSPQTTAGILLGGAAKKGVEAATSTFGRTLRAKVGRGFGQSIGRLPYGIADGLGKQSIWSGLRTVQKPFDQYLQDQYPPDQEQK